MKRFSRVGFSSAVLTGLGLLALGGAPARAGFTVTLDSGSPTGSGPYTYSYTASIPDGDQINAGNFFRIYDFAGYVSGTVTAPAGWTVATNNTDPVPPPNVILSHGDDPAVPNLTFTYNGASPIVGPTAISGFTAQSTFPLEGAIKDFVGRDTKATGPTAGSAVDSVGDIKVPGVPEPSAVVSSAIGLALLGLGCAARSRRRPSA
jgi:hypothetical protein